MLEVVRVVEFVVLPEVHFLQDAAFDEQRQRAIDRGARDRTVDLRAMREQLLGGVMLGGAEGGLNDGVALRRLAQTFLGKISVNAFVDSGSHARQYAGARQEASNPDDARATHGAARTRAMQVGLGRPGARRRRR